MISFASKKLSPAPNFRGEKPSSERKLPRKVTLLEIALKSGKFNHLAKGVRHRGNENHRGEVPQQAKIINKIRTWPDKEKKRKAHETSESWMNTPITFLPVSAEDVLNKPLIVEVVVEGYLKNYDEVHRYQSTFTIQCYPRKVRIKSVKIYSIHNPFNDEIPYFERNINLGNTISHHLEIPSIGEEAYDWRKNNRVKKKEGEGTKEVSMKEEVLVNPAFPDQLVFIKRGLSKECKSQLKLLLKNNIEIFAREPADIIGIGRKLEAYVDDMVIKRNDEKMVLADIAETFDNQMRSNMKLNLKKNALSAWKRGSF
ncbi:hypothetical protein Tco_0000470 [Tanacetum coccineum]